MDPRTPVIVGVGQVQRRPQSPDEVVEPLDLMVEALEAAAVDAGGRTLLERAGSIRVVESLGWRSADPGALVAERLGISPRESIVTATGGNSPQMLVNKTAASILAGEVDVVLITGAEAMYSRRVASKAGQRVSVTTQPEGTPPATVVGLDRVGTHPVEMARSLAIPTQIYPVFENAVRGARGETIAEHQKVIGGLWSRFSEVAAANPNAWQREALSPEEVATPGPSNRMVSFPYPKYLNANMSVDQGAALIMCSVEAAQAAGVPEDQWVFPVSGADAHDHWFVSERWDLHSSPAIAACGRAAFSLAGIGVDDITHVDLYSCFPCAVEIGAEALGFSLDRPLTLTGGLTFGGGPGNNYVTHSIAQLVGALRSSESSGAGTYGLVNANGWYVTKHAVGIYSNRPPEGGFRAADVQGEVDATPKREVADEWDGPATLETYTVHHDRESQPEQGVIACLLPDGRRTWGYTKDPDAMAALLTEDGLLGTKITLKPDGVVTLG